MRFLIHIVHNVFPEFQVGCKPMSYLTQKEHPSSPGVLVAQQLKHPLRRL